MGASFLEYVLKGIKGEIDVKRLANVHYFEFTESFHTIDDSHGFCELVYVDRGRIDIESENYTGELKENCMILHGRDERHSLTCRDDVAPNVIIIGFECSASLSPLTSSPLLLNDELQKFLAEIIKEARSVYLPPYDIPYQAEMEKRDSFAFGADQLIKDYLQIFLIKAVRLSEERALGSENEIRGFSGIAEVKRYLDENFTERIGLEELCFLFGTNRSTLTKEFKATYSSTIFDYINSLRIEYAKRLLSEGERSLTEISELLNLSSVHYLTALFKKRTGISPTEYIALTKGFKQS